MSCYPFHVVVVKVKHEEEDEVDRELTPRTRSYCWEEWELEYVSSCRRRSRSGNRWACWWL